MAKQKTSKTRTPKINLRGVGEVKAATGIFNNRHAVDQKTGKKSSQKIGMRGQGGTPVVPLTASKGKETREIGSIRKMDEDYRIALRESKARWAGMSRDERVALRTARFATVEAAEKAFGRFMSHTENKQTNSVLQDKRSSSSVVQPTDADEERYDPTSKEDARERTFGSITKRRGQQSFRDALIAAYNKRCAITGCSVLDVLEAAHIYPYRGPDTNKVPNGLLLRSDIHTLFDCGLLAIDSSKMTVLIAPKLRDSEYKALHGHKLFVPENPAQHPSSKALDEQRRIFDEQ